MFSTQVKWLIAGLLFALFWASASAATKIGLTTAQPLVIACLRFGIAAFVMLVVSHFIQGHRLPKGIEWRQVAIYGLLNISIYLGLYVVAMQEVTAGIGSLAIAVNPVLISFFSVFLLNRKLTWAIIAGLVVCTVGVIIAAWPLFFDAKVTTQGLTLLFTSMFSYALAAIYFSSKKWNDLSILTINGWQTLIGGLILTPFLLYTYQPDLNTYNLTFLLSVIWLAVPVSIFAILLWLWLLKKDAVRAGLWLFLCPLFGFIIAAILTHEAITLYTIIGVALVLVGLFIGKKTT